MSVFSRGGYSLGWFYHFSVNARHCWLSARHSIHGVPYNYISVVGVDSDPRVPQMGV